MICLRERQFTHNFRCCFIPRVIDETKLTMSLFLNIDFQIIYNKGLSVKFIGLILRKINTLEGS